MAFFDKLNQMAKNIGDKTSDAIETTKLNAKISMEKNAAGEELKKIGAHYYPQFAAGGEVAPEILEFCQNAGAHYDTAAEAQSAIDRIRAENAPPAPAAPASAPTPTPAPTPAPAAEHYCPACGAANAPGTRFCGACGQKLEG